MNADAAVRIAGLSHRFGVHLAVDALDLTVNPGECFGLLGPNGAGKTTTLRVLNTLYPPQSGTVQVFGLDVRRDAMTVRRMLGYVPQQLSIEGALTGKENVSWFARLFDVPRRERAARVAEVLEIVDLTDAADRLASTYSGGMVRRLELAQALVKPAGPARARRADGRPRSGRAGFRLGPGPGHAGAVRDDGAADHALHGGSRPAVRSGSPDAPWPATRCGDTG
ncbi:MULTISPECIES: ABC transporter ATP-binding protein [unclassified Kribbella]|uniref:ABC transporter ATP-binding protein n=1 Tax=unclassified Kribbella TaxID=2644121 RepID=UPI0030159523